MAIQGTPVDRLLNSEEFKRLRQSALDDLQEMRGLSERDMANMDQVDFDAMVLEAQAMVVRGIVQDLVRYI